MASVGKIHTYPNGIRSAYVQATAALAGVKVEEVVHEGIFANDDLKSKFDYFLCPAFEGADGVNIVESGVIAAHVAESAPNSGLIPSEPKARAQVLQYHALVSVEVSGAFSIASDMFANRLPYVKPTFQAIVDKAVRRLQAFEKILVSKTFLVGERITLADISLAFAVLGAFSTIVDPSVRASLPNVIRLAETVTKNSKVEQYTKSFNFLTEAPKYTAPPKDKKPEAAKAPKEAASKAPKAPKAKEADDEDDEPLVPAEPKAKNPLDDLPKSSFNLEEWKRQYSNLDTRKEALPWFYEHFDNTGFSVYKVSFKYNDELTQVFMSSNQVGGFFNRLEASRKYLFGSVGVLGKANDSIITGALIIRGQDVEQVVNVAPDFDSYQYEKLDLSKPEDKEFFEGAMAWDLVVDGKEWADGKNFK